MKPRERIEATLAHEPTDRCPFQATFTPEFAARLRADLGFGAGARHNPGGGGNSYELEVALGQDMLLTSVGWATSYYMDDHHDYVDEWGVGWRVVPYQTAQGIGHHTEPYRHPLADAAALSSYQPPDPRRDDLYNHSQRALAEWGDQYWIVGAVTATIFETAWALRGLEQLLMDFVEAPDLAEEILELPCRYHGVAAERLTRLGVDMIWLGDDIAGHRGLLMSPRAWRRFLKPRMAELIARLKAINPSVKVAYRSDGCLYEVIPDLIEIGIDVLSPIQPVAMDPLHLKRQWGEDLCFWGSMDEQQTLPFGTPSEVRAQVRARIAVLGAGGGLILGPTHHLQLDTPLENFWAMAEECTGQRHPLLAG